MKMSCNGCRVLRKGCSEDCTIRPCLEWIKSPEAQANATVFLAKFYGRAGLLNLLNSGPAHHRPAIFRSLLYEACGRILNPVYGSVGLLWSGSWQLCRSAVESVLKGDAIVPMASDPTATATAAPPIPAPKFYDIRHISKEDGSGPASAELHKVARSRTHFKRSADAKQKNSTSLLNTYSAFDLQLPWDEHYAIHEDGEKPEEESMFSAETVEASHVSQAKSDKTESLAEVGEVGLELTLGFGPNSHACGWCEPAATTATYAMQETSGTRDDTYRVV